MTLRDRPAWRKAVEAARTPHGDDCTPDCLECEEERRVVSQCLDAALPHLAEMFAEMLDERAHKAGNLYRRHAAHAAAAFIRACAKERP